MNVPWENFEMKIYLIAHIIFLREGPTVFNGLLNKLGDRITEKGKRVTVSYGLIAVCGIGVGVRGPLYLGHSI